MLIKKIQKFCLIILCCCVGIGISTLTTSAEGYIRGDVNGDKQITVSDVVLMQRKLLGASVTSFNDEAADVDGNGLNLSDIVRVQRYLLGYENNPYNIGAYIENSMLLTSV